MVTTRKSPSINDVAGGQRVLREGADGNAVKRIQTLLNKKGANLSVDGDFGPLTQAAIQRFQRVHNLKQTGVVDHATLKKLEGPNVHHKDELIKVGDKGTNVAGIEKGLKKLGYDPGTVDGTYDKDTAKAVAQFKHDEDLKKTHGGRMTGDAQKLVRRELHALDHAPLRERVKPSRAHTRLDAATSAAARATDVLGTGGIGTSPFSALGAVGIHQNAPKRIVTNVQAHLKSAGFDPKRTDGTWDARTETAVKAFQKQSGLEVTGRVDSSTWRKLAAARMEATSATSPAQSVGEKSKAVKRTEEALKKAGFKPGKIDGVFDEKTAQAVRAFETKHHLHVDGNVNARDLKAIKKAAKNDNSIDAGARKQMQALLRVAERGASGKQPLGKCLFAVQNYLDQVTYGKGKVPRLPFARNYAEFLNRDNNAAKLGLKKLNITNPYDAPPGAIVVVRAGTPGTAHPTAGDITVKGKGDRFFNDGEMGYGGRQNFPKGNDFVLGIYVPA
jgi:peptidoglycan hydrolase-like protein with peptidoglycan-binding domain